LGSSTTDSRTTKPVFVVTGPSGAGKGTLIELVLPRFAELALCVSATTRARRPGEHDGVEYHFLSRDDFDARVAAGEFLEHARFAGHWYGTPRRPVEERLAAGEPVLLEIELQGARQVRKEMPDALLVFLAPPSWDELVRRLVGRGTETAEERERRLDTARLEMAAEPEFDVTIVNDDVHRATDELVQCMGLVPRPLGVARG
jgi:guanylate kinase